MPKRCTCSNKWPVDFVAENRELFLLSRKDDVLRCPCCNKHTKDELDRIVKLKKSYL